TRCGLSQGDSPEHAGPAAEARWYDVALDVLDYGRRLNISVEQVLDASPHQREQVLLLHNTATDHDPLWRKGADQVHQGQCEIVSLQLPGGMVGRQCIGRLLPAGGNCRPAG